MKTAVVGVGNIGKHHARVYSETKDSQLVAVADLNEVIGQEISKKHNCRFYKSHNELIEKEKPDAVSICVPTSLHRQVASDFIKAGVNVLVEKPIAITIEDAKEMESLAKKHNVKLMIGHVERFNPAVQKLKEIIKSGELGTITSLLARRVGLFPPQVRDTNVIADLAVHDIDVFNYLLDSHPTEIFSGKGKALTNNAEDYASIFLKYNGTNGLIEVNWITPVKIRVLNVTGTKGYAELNYITQEISLYNTTYEKGHEKFGEFVLKFSGSPKRDIHVEKKEPLRVEIEHFLDCVKNNKDPLTNGESAIRTLDVAIRAMKN